MAFQIAGFTTPLTRIAEVDATAKALRTILFDASANEVAPDASAAVPSTQGYLPIGGLDNGLILRAQRTDGIGSERTTTETCLWNDAFDGTTINAFWAVTASGGATVAQSATNVMTLNNGSTTAAFANAFIRSERLFPKLARQILRCRWRVNVTANVAGNHTKVQFGIGNLVSAEQIGNAVYFLWGEDGTLSAVFQYGAVLINPYPTRTVTLLLAQGVISTTAYYDYDIILGDDYARFIVTNSSGVPVVDTELDTVLGGSGILTSSHAGTFAQVIIDFNGGGTAVQANIAAHSVHALDTVFMMPWSDQSASAMRSGTVNPITWVQTAQLAAGAAPAAFTPLNTGPGNTTLGGEAQVNNTATSENLLAIFTYQVSGSLSFMLKRIYIPPSIVTTILGAALGIYEWFVIVNGSTNRIDTAGGQRYALGLHQFASAAAVGTLSTGDSIFWQPGVPLVCTPGSFIHIGWKAISGIASGVFRVVAGVDGYWM